MNIMSQETYTKTIQGMLIEKYKNLYYNILKSILYDYLQIKSIQL